MTDSIEHGRARIAETIAGARAGVEKVEAEYAPDEDRPIRPFVGSMAVYGATVAAGLIVARRTGRPLPERIDGRDLALLGVATHKLSRLIAKEPVTSPLRAPFTRFAGTSGAAELAEEARGTGARHAVGELLTCPFCVAQWVATGFLFGLVFAPRTTRLLASVFACTAVSDYLQFVYSALQEKATG